MIKIVNFENIKTFVFINQSISIKTRKYFFLNTMDSGILGNGITPIIPTYILLPLYSELQPDVFLEILKKIVARTRLGEDYIESAFITGMDSKTLFMKSCEDLSAVSNEHISKSKQIRLFKLMGFWAVNNFPLLGKKLCGEAWQPPKERKIIFGNGETVMDDKQIDEFISPKFKIRVIELSVSNSTWIKIKHFVAVPSNICEKNPRRISKKMKALDILPAHIESCWLALKLGKFLINVGCEVSFVLNKVILFLLKRYSRQQQETTQQEMTQQEMAQQEMTQQENEEEDQDQDQDRSEESKSLRFNSVSKKCPGYPFIQNIVLM